MKKKKESYDFSLYNKKSHKDVQRYFDKHGLRRTIRKLRESFGQEKIIAEYHCTVYEFPYYPGQIKIRENKTSPFKETVRILPYSKND